MQTETDTDTHNDIHTVTLVCQSTTYHTRPHEKDGPISDQQRPYKTEPHIRTGGGGGYICIYKHT